MRLKLAFEKITSLASVSLFFFSVLWTLKNFASFTSDISLDFGVYWFTAQSFIAGHNPYQFSHFFTAFAGPSVTLLIYFPFLALRFVAAQLLFLALSLISILTSIYLSLKIIAPQASFSLFLLITSLTLLAFPTKFTLAMGQNNALALALLLSSFLAISKKKPSLSGILLGLAMVLKPVFSFFGLYYLIKHWFKSLLFAWLTFSGLVVVAGIIAGFHWYAYWLTTILPPLFNLAGREVYYNQGIMGFVARFTQSLSLRQIITIFASLPLLTSTVWLASQKKPTEAQFSLFIVTLLLIDTLSWQHHLIWLVFPFIFLSLQFFKQKNYWLLAIIFAAYLLASFNLKHPENFISFPSSLVLSHGFYASLIIFFLNLYILKTKPPL